MNDWSTESEPNETLNGQFETDTQDEAGNYVNLRVTLWLSYFVVLCELFNFHEEIECRIPWHSSKKRFYDLTDDSVYLHKIHIHISLVVALQMLVEIIVFSVHSYGLYVSIWFAHFKTAQP